ncbi:hypothetical protein BH11BAC4_BH11BAC4_01100 [soil metagenome]
MISRKIRWLPSVGKENGQAIASLEKQLEAFYQKNPDYYGDIEFTADNWINEAEEGYKQIASLVKESNSVCEFGCGSANILKHFPALQSKYSGCDFSEQLISSNRQKYPGAFFETIKVPNELPFAAGKFDLVFSVFVLEHCTRPSKVLDECYRILAPGGRLVILCPDFLGQGRLSSQRAGWSEGTTSDKIKKGKYIDALITFFDNRIRIPFYSRRQRSKVSKQPQFLVNIHPTVFEDKFNPDVDAVYVTCREEIIQYMGDRFTIEENSAAIEIYTEKSRLIFLSLRKK